MELGTARERSVLLGGSVRTLDPERPLAAAVVIEGSKIAAVLDDPADAPAGARRVDLGGGCVAPGLVDAHVHFPSWALARRELRLFGCASLAEALDRVAAAAPAPGGWLRGRGWRDELWGGEKPTRHALDAIAPGARIALRAHDGHSLWLSSAALALADELEVPGGVVEPDAAGEPTGILREESAWRSDDRTRRRAAPRRSRRCAPPCRPPPRSASPACTTRTAGAARPSCSPRCASAGELTLRVWQSLPAERLPTASRHARRPVPADRLRQGVHGRHARLAHRPAARRLRGRDHELRARWPG